MSVLPNTVFRALNVTDDARQDVADQSSINQIPSPSPRPSHAQLSRNNSICTGISPGPQLTPGSTFESSRTYRTLPIIAGVLIPFLVLLSVPSLTNHWYVQVNKGNATVQSSPNPVLLNVAMSLSMACGVLANFCIVLRFSERCVKKMTLQCIILLSINELINIPAVITFALTHRPTEQFVYGQSFWLTVCSMIISAITNITLIIDYSHIRKISQSGSGLTSKQRSLLIIIIVLICYITFGSLVQTFLLKITFIDAVYFSVVSIETIGFGDISPTSTASRIFASSYISGGILNLALAVGLSREALLEAAAADFRERVGKLRVRQRNRHIRERWKAAVKWRLQAKNLPLWVADDLVAEPRQHHNHWWTSVKRFCSPWRNKLAFVAESLPCYAPTDKHLNLNALTHAQLEAAALEAGAPLADLLPSRLESHAGNKDIQPQPPLTHMRIGGMVSLLGQFAVVFTHSHIDTDTKTITNPDNAEDSINEESRRERLEVPFPRTPSMQDEDSFLEALKAEERIAFIARLSIAWLLFIIFWMAGSVMFMKTEGWGMGTAMYFCFIAFSTVGYGDYAPRTQAGRSIFVVWALVGVASVTILVSILTEAYSKSFQSVIRAELIKAEDARQQSFDSHTNTMVNTEASPSLSHSPFPVRNVTFLSSSRNEHSCKIPSVPLTRKVQCEPQAQNMAALSMAILCHTEKLQSLLNSVKNNEIPEIDVYANEVERTIQDIVTAAKDGLGSVESNMG